MNPYVWVALLGAFLSSIAQVMMKKSVMRTYKVRIQEYLNPMVICAYAIFGGTTLIGIYAYQGIPLSMGPVLESTSYLYVTIFGAIIFHEELSRRKILALLMIVCGILVYSLLG